MNSLNSWLGTQLPSLFWLLISAGIFFLLVVLCMYAWRIISRPHVRNTAGRNRQPRLGVLDSYSVDRVRQLVLVRRDNVEHLIMIGGPNDLVVESGILRGRPMAARPVPPPVPEKAPTFNAAPRQIEEDFARPADTGPFAAPKPEFEPKPEIQPRHEPVAAAPAPVPAAPTVVVPPAAPALPIDHEPVPSFLQREPEPTFSRESEAPMPSESPADESAEPAGHARRSVVPPRGPGFFQRATSRFPNFGRQVRGTPSVSTPAPDVEPGVRPEPGAEEADTPAVDTTHFEELLSQRTPPAVTPDITPTEDHATEPQHEELSEEPLFEQEPNEFETGDEDEDERTEEATEPQLPLFEPVAARLTLPEIRLPDLKIPGWRRPVAEYSPMPDPRASFEVRPEPRPSFDVRSEPRAPFEGRPEPRTSFEGRPEPRFSNESRPGPDDRPPSRLEPLLATNNTPARRYGGESQSLATPPSRPDIFRIGDRVTPPTHPTGAAPRPAAPPPAAEPPAPPPEPEDPFASLEEEMANLLGRGRDNTKP